MHQLLSMPFSPQILQKRRQIRRELKGQGPFQHVRIAILGGATTNALRDVLELFLLDNGIEPAFYESEYNKWYEDAVFPNAGLETFAPQIVIFHTSIHNLTGWPDWSGTDDEAGETAWREAGRFLQAWRSIREKFHCVVIQDNFCLPSERIIGNYSFAHPGGTVHFINCLNRALLSRSAEETAVYIHDVCYLSAQVGLRSWMDEEAYSLYKMAVSFTALPYYCHSLAQIIQAIYGKTKKCLVLDLDNTLWGGIIGEDGVEGIQLGRETAEGEAYLAFQRYVKRLEERGVILAACSKNDRETALEGLAHPDSLLNAEDFSALAINWEPKDQNILRLAEELKLGTDAMVFVDDSPAERALVREKLPEVVVPEVTGGVPSSYIRALEDGLYFETVSLSADDLNRSEAYRANRRRMTLKGQYTDYDSYLRSLEMEAEITPFSRLYLDRITQLANKTNQFNLTTLRYTRGELETIMNDPAYLTLCCRLKDKFGDNGIISLLIGKQSGSMLEIELWLMSCRVLGRRVEDALFSVLLRTAPERGVKALRGVYRRTPKNGMAADLYRRLGFTPVGNDGVTWQCEIEKCRPAENLPIGVSFHE